MKNKVTMLNIVSSLIVQIVSIISGLIVPRIILATFGSGVNGLVLSINQYLNYIALIEGGITGVVAANLYKPLVENDTALLSSVVATARSFYRKISVVLLLYTIGLALVYPRVKYTGFSNSYVFLLTIVLSIALMLQYMFSLTMITLLQADKKGYVVYFTQTVIVLANIVMVFISVKLFPDIVFLKFLGAIWYVLQPVVYGIYIKKHYNLDAKAPKDNNLLDQRWNGFSVNLAFFIHSCTDITLLTILSDYPTVSVYGVYSLIISKVSMLVHSLGTGIEPTIGQAYARQDKDELNQRMDLFEYITFASVGFLFTVMGLLITPFVVIYTHGVNDADYYQPLFGIMLTIAEALYLLKYPHTSLAFSANKYKEIMIPTYIEAGINILVSLLLIGRLGLVGVAIGTAAAMLYRMIFHIFFTAKMIEGRRPFIFYRKLLIFTAGTLIAVAACHFLLPFREFSYAIWFFKAVCYSLIVAVVYLMISILFFRQELGFFIRYIKKH